MGQAVWLWLSVTGLLIVGVVVVSLWKTRGQPGARPLRKVEHGTV